MPLWHHHVHGLRFTSYVHGRPFAAVELFNLHVPQEIIMPAITLSVGHTAAGKIAFLDQNGNPLITPPTPDATPVWTNTTPATGTITPSTDGLSAIYTPVAAGSNAVTFSLSVGGVSFTGTTDFTVSAEAQVLTSVVANWVVSA